MIAGTDRYECPVDGCGWTLNVPPPSEPEWSDNRVFVTSPAAVEAWLRLHVEHHRPEEFLRTIQMLRAEVAAAPPVSIDAVIPSDMWALAARSAEAGAPFMFMGRRYAPVGYSSDEALRAENRHLRAELDLAQRELGQRVRG